MFHTLIWWLFGRSLDKAVQNKVGDNKELERKIKKRLLVFLIVFLIVIVIVIAFMVHNASKVNYG